MKRRGWTVLVGLVLVGMLTWQLLAITVPYVVLGPGPTFNTLGTAGKTDVIQVDGAPTSTSAGQLRLVTVSVTSRVTLANAIYYWLDRDTAVVPRELVYPPDKSQQQIDKENVQQFQDSQTSAETAALHELGYPLVVSVKSVASGKPAAGRLAPGDVLTSIDGQQVKATDDVARLVQAKPVGSILTIGYTRAGKAGTTTVTSEAGESGKPIIGIVVETLAKAPFKVDINLSDIGGPSAGLMFSLGVVDKLTPADLTGGLDIAGTGTIDDTGAVGPIGGIAQKLVAAKRDGAAYFLTPDANCREAVANAQPGLPLVKVTSLDDALAALTALRDHRQPALCSAGDGQ